MSPPQVSAPHASSQRWRALIGFQQWMAFPLAVLSAAWLVIAILDLTGHGNPALSTIGVIIWIIFIAEFLLSLTIAPDKPRYLRRNVLTIISLVVPALRLFRALAVLRAASVLRGANLIRIVGVINRSMGSLRRTMRRRAFAYVLALTVAVLAAGAAGMYNLEPASEVRGGFTDYWDSLWWTGMLLTSIGSQYWPQTGEGRLLGFLLSLYGLGILGYMTATIASFFIGRDAADPRSEVAGSDDIAGLRREIAELKAMLRDPERR